MPYVQRDNAGSIIGLFANRQAGFAEEWLDDGHPDLQPRPSDVHYWQDGAWVLDEAVQLEAARAAERAWRDARLASTDYLAMPDYPLTSPARAELYTYRQALRDWPQSAAFPAQADRPQPPEWLADQSLVREL